MSKSRRFRKKLKTPKIAIIDQKHSSLQYNFLVFQNSKKKPSTLAFYSRLQQLFSLQLLSFLISKMLPTIVLGACTGIYLYRNYDIERLWSQCSESMKHPNELLRSLQRAQQKYKRTKEPSTTNLFNDHDDDQ